MKYPAIKFVPVMKGRKSAFTCLGNWYDFASPRSMGSLYLMLYTVTPSDLKTARAEIKQAIWGLS